MDEIHVSSIQVVLRAMQRLCRIGDATKNELCKREIYERLMTEEIAQGHEPEYIQKRIQATRRVDNCFDECRLNGKNEVRACNTKCFNTIVREVWARFNVPEIEAIVAKYAD